MGATITQITVTGADNNVDSNALHDLRREHPSVEWGILYDPEQRGGARYPDNRWIRTFLRNCREGSKALHLRGKAVGQFVEGDAGLAKLAAEFNRVQLDIWRGTVTFTVGDLDAAIAGFKKPVIIPYNRVTKDMAGRLTAPNRMILFNDLAVQANPPPPLEHTRCGYDCGLNEKTLPSSLPKILNAAVGHRVWIALEEGGARDYHDFFDPARVVRSLQIVASLTK